jgi:nucleotide-binding universal stress UspA family protein
VRKLFWLLDPFEKPSDAVETGAWVAGLSEKLKIPIQPVHVLSGGALAFSPEIHAAWLMQVALQAETRLRKLVDRLKVPHLLPPVVLSEIYRSRSEAVAALLEFARESDVELFVLQRLSGAKKNAKIGGFAETLLLKSEIPVLVVPRHRRSELTIKPRVPSKLVVGLDLEGDPLPMLDLVFQWAKRLGARVHLFHSALPYPSMGYRATADIFPGDWSGPVAPMTLSSWQADLQARRKRMESFRVRAQKKGVPCTIEIDSASTRAVDGLLRCARARRADWIAVAGKSGKWSALILGSVSRTLAREAPCPVWIVRLESERESEKRSARKLRAA